MSPGSLGSCRRSGLSHGLSLHVELERTRQRALTSRMLNAGRRGRLGALPDFQEEDDGLWALCETALFAVLQAPVGAVFASMGAVASTAPRGAPAVLLGPGRHGRRGTGGGVPPVPTGPAVTGLGLARPKRSVMSGRSSVGAQQRGTAVMSPGSRSESRAGAVCASSLP